MARFIVDAAVEATAQEVWLVISVSTADNGLPRVGLVSTNFDVVALAPTMALAPQQIPIAQVVEGPPGVYQITLDGVAGMPQMQEHAQIILAVTVSGDAEAGWADDRGQTIAVGAILTSP